MSRPPGARDDEGLFTDDELSWEDEPTAGEGESPPPAPGWPTRAGTGVAPELYRRRRLAAAGAAAVVLVAAIAIGVLVAGGGGGETSTSLAPTTGATQEEQPATTATTTAAPAPQVSLPGGKALKQGATGAAVRTLQQALVQLGFDVGGKVDGDFGSATKAAVAAFQTRQGLTADGIVGSKTVDALNAALAG